MIKRAPLKTDPAGKCSRWWVKIYNPSTHKHDMHTVRGSLTDAKAYEREQQQKLGTGTYLARRERKTVQEVHDLWFGELRARARRASTLADYTSSLSLYILPAFGPREVGAVRKADVRKHFNGMREKGRTVATVNKAIRAFKALMNFALDSELIDRNPLSRFKQFARVKGERTVKRGVFTEAEMSAIFAAATPRERALLGVLFGTGVRPGEAYALDWQSVDLKAGRLAVRRSSCYRSGTFVEPKTAAGNRLVPLSPWVAEQLAAYRASSGAAPHPTALVFPSEDGTPFNPSNVRRDIWLPLKARARVRDLDLYSLRHTFVTYARAGGMDAFNVSRVIGHAKSTIVDSVYANHTLDSGIAPISAAVTDRVFGTAPGADPPGGPGAPGPGRGRPKLHLVGGGKT